VTGKPAKLLLVTTGNIDNQNLLAVIRVNMERIEAALESSD
jgi:predicted nuclease of predicted toxin-antitoxin system